MANQPKLEVMKPSVKFIGPDGGVCYTQDVQAVMQGAILLLLDERQQNPDVAVCLPVNGKCFASLCAAEALMRNVPVEMVRIERAMSRQTPGNVRRADVTVLRGLLARSGLAMVAVQTMREGIERAMGLEASELLPKDECDGLKEVDARAQDDTERDPAGLGGLGAGSQGPPSTESDC